MERKHKILIAAGAVILLLLISIPAIMIAGTVLWQLGVFKAGSAGMGSSGFGMVKPIDHSSSGAGNMGIVFMNAVGSTVDINSVKVDGRELVLSAVEVKPGEIFNVDGGGIPGMCPPGDDNYDVHVTVTYTNQITGLSHTTDTGRIWGPCS
ncbi:MAG: hypothetical protein KAU03_03685 [Candidatus Altiarchaeales archaeon]|nr:hypothetical protein [Candidatus Altiarchaeales archaeon]